MQRLSKHFYLRLYFFWLLWVGIRSAVTGLFLSALCIGIIYISKGAVSLNENSVNALLELFYFLFPIFSSLAYILNLLLVFKAVFSFRYEHRAFELYDCKDETIKQPLTSDVIMLWRKWLFVSLWLIFIFLVLVLGGYRIIMSELPPLSWFNGINIYLLVSLIGGSVFVWGLPRCQKVRIKDV